MAIPVSNSIPPTGDPLIDGLLQGGSWTTDGDPAHTAHELTYSLDLSPSSVFWGGYADVVAAALTAWSNVANITFVEIDDGENTQFNQASADLAFSLVNRQMARRLGLIGISDFPDPNVAGQSHGFYYAINRMFQTSFDANSYPHPEGDIFFESDRTIWPGFADIQPGGAELRVMMHEIGHALGLKHPFDDGANGRHTFAQLGIGSKNTGLWTIMSYGVTSPLLTAGNQATPMPLDILAIQHIYGANMTYHAGDDTYALADDGKVWTIWDAGGVDTIDASTLSKGLTLDLHEASFIRTGTHSVTAIAYNVAIENAIGSNFADNILGNTVDNHLTGGGGNDTMNGDSGNDSINGGPGADRMTGGAGDDNFIADNKGDVAIETSANGGHDVVTSYVSFTLGANIEDLILAPAASAALAGTGNAADNFLQGNEFNNTLDGKAGDDTMIGGKGDDVYVVDSASNNVIENPGEGTDEIRTTLGSRTAVANVEDYTFTGKTAVDFAGNGLDNKITGAAKSDTLDGGDGNDTLDGHAGADSLTGGIGNDTYVIDSAMDKISETGSDAGDTVQAAITVDLSLAAFAGIENVTLTGTAALSATGSGTANHLVGNDGANVLDGKGGADTLEGGKGNDIYLVDNSADVVIEVAGGGTDTVKSAVTYTLADPFVENLTLLAGAGNISATGNALANMLTGNEGNNALNGGLGADKMIGGLGDDTYIVDNTKDIVTEAAKGGTDTVQSSVTYTLGTNVENLLLFGAATLGTGNALDNVITGNDAGDKLGGLGGNDTITGGASNDTIDGGLGNDSLVGGAGNDTYILSSPLDVVHESAAGGSDTVLAGFSIDLTTPAFANVENVTLLGTVALFATGTDADNNVLIGNSGANTLIGNGGDDTLKGGVGADNMIGGAGNDVYVVDNAKDVVDETSGSGTDTVQSSISFTLVENGTTVRGTFENLTLTGTGGISGTGNDLANLIIGNSGANKLIGNGGNDTLDGGAGNDTLTGGSDSDTFVRHALTAEGKDTITDFQTGPGGDKLDIHDLLTGFDSGTSNPNDFVHLAESGGNTTVQIDANGTVGGAAFTSVVVLSGVTGLDVGQLVSDGNLQLA